MTTWYFLQKAMKLNNANKNSLNFQEHFDRFPEYFAKTKDEINSRCRVCLQSGTIHIYSKQNAKTIVNALQTIAGVKITEYDNNPKVLCSICYQFIETAILFRKTAKRSEEILKQPIKIERFVDNVDNLNHIDHDHNYTDEAISDTKKPSEVECTRLKKGEIKTEKKEKTQSSAKVTCQICKKVVNRSYYKEHATTHDPDNKQFVCDVCGKSFVLKCAYYNHIRQHRNNFPHKCTFCPYRGRYAELLKIHMRTHTGDYKYMCTECPARFLFKSNLNRHMRKHKVPQFKCDTCKRAFHTTLTLQRHHEADHLGIKNHVCNICGKAFGYRNAMMKHQRHVHKREKLLFGRMPSYLEAENEKQND